MSPRWVGCSKLKNKVLKKGLILGANPLNIKILMKSKREEELKLQIKELRDELKSEKQRNRELAKSRDLHKDKSKLLAKELKTRKKNSI